MILQQYNSYASDSIIPYQSIAVIYEDVMFQYEAKCEFIVET